MKTLNIFGFTAIQTVRSYISTLLQARKLILYVRLKISKYICIPACLNDFTNARECLNFTV